MVYKKYYIQIIIRIVLILLNCLVFCYILLQYVYIYTITLLGVLILLQTIQLIRYINKSNIFLERFLIHVKEKNTTINFSESLENTPFKDLTYYFNEINNIIKNTQIEKENQYLFLQYILDHVNIGLIAFKKNYNIKLINTSAKQTLNIQALTNINNIKDINILLYKSITELKPGEQRIIPMQIANKNVQLSLKLSRFKLLNEEICLVSLQDIKPELDHKEIESWKKLNRVLTHEIMNSVSPIIGLTNNISKLLKKNNVEKKGSDFDYATIEQVIQSLNIIEDRSLGLEEFVYKFKNVTATINSTIQKVRIHDLFEDISILMHETFETNNINYNYSVKPLSLELHADKRLIQQVLINLLKNSIEALTFKENKNIILEALIDENRKITINVIDNGIGILPENLDMIFTPFYTTKESGSGIGLSLSRNILKQQGLDLDVFSIPNIKTIFTIHSL